MNGLMYFIRIAITIIVMSVAFFFMKKKRRLTVIIVSTVIVLFILSLLLPIEHFVGRFKTPIDAYCYSHFDSDIIDVVYGEDSALILSKDRGGSYAVWIIQKDSNGYVIPLFGSVDIVKNDGRIQTVRLKNTNDYYYYGAVKENDEVFLSLDKIEFHTLPLQIERYVFCYGYIGDMGVSREPSS